MLAFQDCVWPTYAIDHMSQLRCLPKFDLLAPHPWGTHVCMGPLGLFLDWTSTSSGDGPTLEFLDHGLKPIQAIVVFLVNFNGL